MSGYQKQNGISGRTLTTNFELLNLVPTSDQLNPSKAYNVNQQSPNEQQNVQGQKNDEKQQHQRSTTSSSSTASKNVATKWRRVGLVSASTVRLDTIVWPGGDIVVSGKSSYDCFKKYFCTKQSNGKDENNGRNEKKDRKMQNIFFGYID